MLSGVHSASKSKKKILFIITPFEVGGAEEYIYLLSKGIISDYDVTIACPASRKFDDFIKRFKEIEINILRLNIKSRREYKIPSIFPAFDFKQIYSIYRVIKKIKPDIIHINQNEPEEANSAMLATAVIKNTPVVSTMHVIHSYKFIKVPFAFIRDKWAEIFLNLFSFPIITVSHEGKSLFLRNYLINKNRIFAIQNGIDLERYKVSNYPEKIKYKLTKEIGFNNKFPIIGFIGRLTKPKGALEFLKIAHKVLDREKNVYFVMLGMGELEKDLKKYIYDNNFSDRIKLLGFVDNVPDYLSIMDILLLPSFYESFGMVLAEAGAMGIPVIAGNKGGTNEVVKDKITGFLVDNPSCDKFAERVVYLLKNPDVANEIGLKAQKRIRENFSLSKMINNTLALYENVLHKI